VLSIVLHDILIFILTSVFKCSSTKLFELNILVLIKLISHDKKIANKKNNNL